MASNHKTFQSVIPVIPFLLIDHHRFNLHFLFFFVCLDTWQPLIPTYWATWAKWVNETVRYIAHTSSSSYCFVQFLFLWMTLSVKNETYWRLRWNRFVTWPAQLFMGWKQLLAILINNTLRLSLWKFVFALKKTFFAVEIFAPIIIFRKMLNNTGLVPTEVARERQWKLFPNFIARHLVPDDWPECEFFLFVFTNSKIVLYFSCKI